MATKLARLNGPHSAGIFADMTVDGPEIGTLVLIVDRAKNLPNKKSMGKQNPYCAARLGKEAKKTEVDKRGGQTPRWDQELRFTVHDSSDYYGLKISVFSEDKRTDLIGEAWVNLTDVIVPGGARNDLWQGLNCKGRYAGELRIELTYYDSRQKPDKVADVAVAEEDLRMDLSASRVKRRPLPTNPNIPSTTPVVIPERPPPGRARHGPRDFQTLQRPNSLPLQELSYPHSQATLMVQKPVHEHPATSNVTPVEIASSNQDYGGQQEYSEPESYTTLQPDRSQHLDFLPQLEPSARQRASMLLEQHIEPHVEPNQPQSQHHPPPHRHSIAIPHSHSEPSIPMYYADHRGYGSDEYQPVAEYSEPDPTTEYQYRQTHQQPMNNAPPGWDPEYRDPYSDKQMYPEHETELAPPPPPPVHSNSAPAVPLYSPPHGEPQYSSPQFSSPQYESNAAYTKPQYIPNSSPLQSIERNYGPPSRSQPQDHHVRGSSTHEQDRSRVSHGYINTPSGPSPVQMVPHAGGTPPSQQMPSRHSISDPYTTPSRPHPLSQEIPRALVPEPYRTEEPPNSLPRSYAYVPHERRPTGGDAVPMIKPRAISPHPVPTPASQQYRQYSTPPQPLPPPQEQLQQPQQQQPHQPPSKVHKPRSSYNIQFPVRAFESSDGNPLSTSQPPPQRAAPVRKSVSPRPSMTGSSSAVPFSPDSFDMHNPSRPSQPSGDEGSRDGRGGPIVDWDGKEIHPSDHLPVDSWAPEPKQKTAPKTYGLGRDRDFGPRTPQGLPTSAGRISKDTVINVRMRNQAPAAASVPAIAPDRNTRYPPARHGKSPAEPLRDHRNYNPAPHPYSHQEYSRSFTEGMPDGRGNQYHGSEPPSIPPKVPFQHQQPHSAAYDRDALSREISSIDIGSSRNRPPPSASGYVPVRSHRDRNTFY